MNPYTASTSTDAFDAEAVTFRVGAVSSRKANGRAAASVVPASKEKSNARSRPVAAAMLKPSPTARFFLHLANLLVIAFFLLPIFAVVIGAVQSERSLQAATRAVFPPEYTLDNFRVILTGGEQRGRIFEQVTYLPDNIKQFHRAFLNSTIVALSVTLLTLTFAVALLAQASGEAQFGPRGFGGAQSESKLVKQYDKDGDGRLNGEERKAARAAIGGSQNVFRPFRSGVSMVLPGLCKVKAWPPRLSDR